MPSAPTRAELEALAERALAHVGDDEAQATAWWEPGGTRVELLVVRDGRMGRAVTNDPDDEALARSAREAAAAAADGPPLAALPDPAPGRPHDGYDPAVLDPSAVPDDGLDWRLGAARIAIASTRGVRAYEQRSFAAARARAVPLTAAAVGPAGVDAAALAREAAALAEEGDPAPVPSGEPVVVLGHDAVAAILDRLRADLHGGRLRGRLATRVVAPNINLSDSPRFPATLPRSYDDFGAPLEPTPLIQDGVLHRLPGRPPTHLVLVGGGAADVHELLAPVDEGLYIAAIDGAGRAHGAFHLRCGRRAAPAADLRVEVDPLEVLAHTQALSARQRAIPVGLASARTASATVCPALRTAGGVRVRS